jgi:hypothetical protein
MALQTQNLNTPPAGLFNDEELNQVPLDTQATSATPTQMTPVSVASRDLEAHSPAGAAAVFSASDMAEAGFAGLTDEVGIYDFPIVKLDKGEFKDSNGRSLGKKLVGFLVDSRPQWLIRALTNVSKPGQIPKWDVVDNKTDLAYTYDPPTLPDDQRTTSKAKPLSEVKAEWKGLGKVVEEEEKKYLIVMFCVEVGDGDEFVQLQIPGEKTSIARFNTFYRRQQLTLGRGVNRPRNAQEMAEAIRNLRVSITVGAEVTGVKNPFTPWQFDLAKPEDKTEADEF